MVHETAYFPLGQFHTDEKNSYTQINLDARMLSMVLVRGMLKLKNDKIISFSIRRHTFVANFLEISQFIKQKKHHHHRE